MWTAMAVSAAAPFASSVEAQSGGCTDAIAKIEVERRVTEAGAEANGVWDAVVTNPGDNYGPLLAAHQLGGGGGGFPNNIKRLLEGKKIAKLGAYHPM